MLCVWEAPLGAAAIQVIKNKRENTIWPTFLIRFICYLGFVGFVLFCIFQLAFILKAHNLHYFLVHSRWTGAGRAGISNKRFTKACPELCSRCGPGTQNAAAIQSSGAGEFLCSTADFRSSFASCHSLSCE